MWKISWKYKCITFLNPSWSATEIANFMQATENPPQCSRKLLMQNINWQLKRGTVEDKPRSGCPATASTHQFQKKLEIN